MVRYATLRSRPIFYGWWIVLTGTVVSALVGGSVFYGMGAFFAPIQRTFGLSYAVVSGAYSLQSFAMGALAPLIGWLFNRIGPRRLAVAGLGVAGVGLLELSRSAASYELYVAFALMGIGTSACTFLLFNSLVTLWFERHLGTALFLVQAGYGFGGLMGAAYLYLITNFGWRTAAAIPGLALVAVCVPAGLILRHRPEDLGLQLDGDGPISHESTTIVANNWSTSAESNDPTHSSPNAPVSEAIRTSSFWIMAFVFTISTAVTGVVFVHQIPAMMRLGVPTQVIGIAVASVTGVGLVGRWGFGWLTRAVSSRKLFAAALALQTSGTLAFSLVKGDAPLTVFLYAVLFGIGQGGIFLLQPVLQKDYFGRRDFAAIQGLLLGATILGGALAPTIAGSLVDALGSYRPVFLLAGALCAPLVLVMLLSRPPPHLQPGTLAP